MTANRFCNGATRRDFIRIGTAGAFGLGLNLPSILQAQLRATERGQPTRLAVRWTTGPCIARRGRAS